MNSIKEVIENKNCCGCLACVYSCPRNCINEGVNSKGFIEPVINMDNCVNCGQCKSVCPIYSIPKVSYPHSAYGLSINNLDTIRNSSSGGAFMLFALRIIQNGGSVFGCKYDRNLMPIIDEASSIEQLFEMQGSKYVQAYTNNVYRRVQTKLDSGKEVLFCSTPCQVAALKKYLRREYSQLLLIDIFCEGTPGQGLWTDYISYLSRVNHGVIEKIVFRDGNSWNDFFPSPQGYYVVKNKRMPFGSNYDPYYNSFLRHNTYGKVCYSCPYASEKRVGDISIGDFWGISTIAPERANKYGNSAVLVNTSKGQSAFESVRENALYWNARVEDIAKNNYVLSRPTELCKEREEIINAYNTMPFDRFVKCYLGRNTRFYRVVARKIINTAKKLRSKDILSHTSAGRSK